MLLPLFRLSLPLNATKRLLMPEGLASARTVSKSTTLNWRIRTEWKHQPVKNQKTDGNSADSRGRDAG